MGQTKYEEEMSSHNTICLIVAMVLAFIIHWLSRPSKNNRLKDKSNVHVIDCDAVPFQPNDWSVEKHAKGGQFKWNPTKVKLYLSKSQKPGNMVDGKTLRKELEGQKVLNANVLDYLLAHPELIPDEWKGKTIFFWGTIYRRAVGELFVRSLQWNGSQWHCSYDWLGFDFNDKFPAAVSV